MNGKEERVPLRGPRQERMKIKKPIKKLLSFLTICCCLAGSMAPVSAAGGQSPNPRVTFTNEPTNLPDLYVTKKMEEGTQAGQYDQFCFLLKLNGEKAQEREYRLYELGAEGGRREIVKKDASRNRIPFETDNDGIFTLEAGQQACFEGVGGGAVYEVAEQTAYLEPVKKDEAGEPPQFEEIPSSDREHYYQLYYKAPEDEEGRPVGDDTFIRTALQSRQKALKKGRYRVVSPAGGTTGECTMPDGGDAAVFTNSRTPEGSGDTADLVIGKTVSFPAGWTRPAGETFWFRLELDVNGSGLDGAYYANEEYTAVDPETKESRTGRTGPDGSFWLPGGWKATFADIPVDTEYRVCELVRDTVQNPAAGGTGGVSARNSDADGGTGGVSAQSTDAGGGAVDVSLPTGWWPVGRVTKGQTETGASWERVMETGAVTAPQTPVDFANSNVSFVVTKNLNPNEKPDVDFQFRLTDNANNGLANKSYYLYQTTGEPVLYNADHSQEGDQQGPQVRPSGEDSGNRYLLMRQTGADGAFILKPGQAAVFIGIAPGTVYKVTETGTPSYIQELPLPKDRDRSYTVPADGSIQPLNFVNRFSAPAGALSVLKRVETPGGEGAIEKDKKFRFRLYQRLKTLEELNAALKLNASDNEKNKVDQKVAEEIKSGKLVLLPLDADSVSGEDWTQDYHYTHQMPSNTKIYAEIYVPMSKAYYELPDGKGTPNAETDADGEFTLEDGQTAQFTRLTAGKQYLVRELDPGKEYEEQTPGNRIGRGLTQDGAQKQYYRWVLVGQYFGPAYAQTAELTDEALNFTFTNVYTPEKADVTICKTNDSGEPLEGAEFMLYLQKGREPAWKVVPTELPEGVTAEDFCYRTEFNADKTEASVCIPDLKAGTYWLYETKAPHRYSLLQEPIELEVAREDDGTLTVKIDGRPYTDWSSAKKPNSIVGDVQVTDRKSSQSRSADLAGAASPSGGEEASAAQKSADAVRTADESAVPETHYDIEGSDDDSGGTVVLPPAQGDSSKAQIRLTVLNVELYDLPGTGSIGIYWYLIGGTLLMMAAVLILYKKILRGRC